MPLKYFIKRHNLYSTPVDRGSGEDSKQGEGVNFEGCGGV